MADTFTRFTNQNGNTFSVIALPNTGFFQYEYETDVGSDVEQTFLQKTGRWVFGISHLIEHLSFKSPADYTSDELMHKLKTEGTYNAYTNFGAINYYYSSIVENYKTAITLALNIALNDLTRVNSEEFESERAVVANEIRRYNDDAQSIFGFEANAVCVGRNKNDNILGDANMIECQTLQDCITIKSIFLQIANPVHRITYDPEVVSLDEIIQHIEQEQCRLRANINVNHQITREEYLDGSKKQWVDYGNPPIVIPSSSEMCLISVQIPHDNYEFASIPLTISNYLGYQAKHSINELIREKHGLTYGVSFTTSKISNLNAYIFSVDVPKDKYELALELFKTAIAESIAEFDEVAYDELVKSYQISFVNSAMNRRSAMNLHSMPSFSPGWTKYKVDYETDLAKTIKMARSEWQNYELLKNEMKKVQQSIERGEFIIVRN